MTLDHLAGKRGMTMTPLVPAGKVQFGDDVVDCISNGELIAKARQMTEDMGRRAATVAEARAMLAIEAREHVSSA